VGYRAAHIRLKQEAEFEQVSLKKVQLALQAVRSAGGDYFSLLKAGHAAAVLWEVTDFEAKGKGVRALAPLPRGTVVLKEKPIMAMKFEMARDIMACCDEHMARQITHEASVDFVAREFAKLAEADQARMLDLYDCAQAFHVDVGSEPILILLSAKFWSNSVPGPPAASDPDEEDTVLCPSVARFNHSCKANAIYTWHGSAKAGEVCIVTTADILPGE
ncbi:unnamed protein product, partial [Polarella glacialis]